MSLNSVVGIGGGGGGCVHIHRAVFANYQYMSSNASSSVMIWEGVAESSVCRCFLGFSGTAPLCPIPRCICPLRARIKQALRAADQLSHHSLLRGADWAWWFQPHLQRNPREPGDCFRRFKRLNRNYTLTQDEDTKATQNIKFPCFCWELQVCMVLCGFQVLIGCGWHNRNFWDRIGLTLDIVTRAGIRSHSPSWAC